MEWGETEALFDDLPEDAPTPKSLLNAPQLWAGNREYYNAFLTLNPSRQTGFGVGAIPLSEVVAYVALFAPEDVETLVHRVRMCDDIYLEWQAKKQASNSAKRS